MSAPRTAHCVFCDDVRHEIGNKISLMGVYQADIVIQGRKPQLLPKLVVAIWLASDIDDPVQELTVRILIPPDQKELAEIKSTPPDEILHKEGAMRRILFFVIPIIPFPCEEDGFIEVMIETEVGSLRAGRLMIKFSDTAPESEFKPT